MTQTESTRTAGLLRVTLGLIAWLQVGGTLHVGMAESPSQLLLIGIFYVAAMLMVIGWHGRLATAVTGVCLMSIYHVFGDSHGELQRHQSWLLASCITWLSLSPCSRSLSIDRVKEPRRERGSGLGLFLIRCQLSVLYLFGALHKMTPAFLSGERLQHIASETWFGSDVPNWSAAFASVACATVVFELVLAVGLWMRRPRRILLPLGIAMHVTFAMLLPVQTFTALMIVLYLAFVPPDAVHATIHRLTRGHEAPPTQVRAHSVWATRGKRGRIAR